MTLAALITLIRCTLPVLSARLFPPFIGLFLAFTQVDAVVSWPNVATELRAMPTLHTAVGLTVWSVLWTSAAAPAIREAMGSPSARWAWRQPIPRLGWGCLAGILALLGTAPVWLAPLFWGDLAALATALLLTVAASSMALGAAARDYKLVAVSILVMPLVVAAGRSVPASVIALPIALPGLAAAWGQWAPRIQADLAHPRPPPVLTPSVPITALLIRDLLALRHESRWYGVALVLAAFPAGAVQILLQVNGKLHGVQAAQGAIFLLAVAGLAPMVGLVGISDTLGDRLDPRRQPVSALLRVASLVVLTLTMSAPAALAVVFALGAPLHTPWVLAALLSLATGAVLSLLSARSPAQRAHTAGRHLWWTLLTTPLLVLTPPFGPIAACTLSAAAFTTSVIVLASYRRHA